MPSGFAGELQDREWDPNLNESDSGSEGEIVFQPPALCFRTLILPFLVIFP